MTGGGRRENKDKKIDIILQDHHLSKIMLVWAFTTANMQTVGKVLPPFSSRACCEYGEVYVFVFVCVSVCVVSNVSQYRRNEIEA